MKINQNLCRRRLTQGSLTISLGIRNPDSLSETLATVMTAEMQDMEPFQGQGIIHHCEGIDLLPANIELSGVELGLFNTMSRETVLRTVLNRLKPYYDHILIDCMPSLGLMTINALTTADSVIIPTQPNFLSTKGLNLLLRSVSRVRKQINPKLRIDGILFTMVDSRTNNAQSVISSMRDTVGGNIRVFQTEIPRSVRAAEAAEAGESIFSYDKNGKVAQAYSELLNSLYSNAVTKLTIYNHTLHRIDFEWEFLIMNHDEELKFYSDEMNDVLRDKTVNANRVFRELLITVTADKKDIMEAREYFNRVGSELKAHFAVLGSKCTALDAEARLRILHNFYRKGDEEAFSFNIKEDMRRGHDFRDRICPDHIERHKDYLRLGDR